MNPKQYNTLEFNREAHDFVESHPIRLTTLELANLVNRINSQAIAYDQFVDEVEVIIQNHSSVSDGVALERIKGALARFNGRVRVKR